VADIVAACDVALRLAYITAVEHLLGLVRLHLRLAAHLNILGDGALATITRASMSSL
jgi:hypothetical protein